MPGIVLGVFKATGSLPSSLHPDSLYLLKQNTNSQFVVPYITDKKGNALPIYDPAYFSQIMQDFFTGWNTPIDGGLIY